MTEKQREAKRELARIYRRRIDALKRQIKDAQEAARAKRLAVRPDAHGRTSDDVAREFETMTCFGEEFTTRYRGTGFYAGNRRV